MVKRQKLDVFQAFSLHFHFIRGIQFKLPIAFTHESNSMLTHARSIMALLTSAFKYVVWRHYCYKTVNFLLLFRFQNPQVHL